MSDATLLADLISAGVTPELVARVAAALANVRDSPGHVRDIVRAYEASRKKTQRKNSAKSGGKQTMSVSIKKGTGNKIVPDTGKQPCDLSSFSSSTASQRSREVKKEEQAKRGTRMQPGATISVEDWQFARDQGHNDTQIKSMWAEYVDYWIGIPGSRGLKLDWPATWRNRVRSLSAQRGRVNGHGAKPSAMATAFDELKRRVDHGSEADIGDGTPILDLRVSGD